MYLCQRHRQSDRLFGPSSIATPGPSASSHSRLVIDDRTKESGLIHDSKAISRISAQALFTISEQYRESATHHCFRSCTHCHNYFVFTCFFCYALFVESHPGLLNFIGCIHYGARFPVTSRIITESKAGWIETERHSHLCPELLGTPGS